MDYPIIFSPPMVRALLDGRKTMTRRIPTAQWRKVAPGDRLWVRENWQDYCPLWDGAWCGHGTTEDIVTEHLPVYRADPSDRHLRGPEGKQGVPLKWRPSIHMPRWASRLTLAVTATKIERLQDIGWKDAIAEGIERGDPMPEVPNSHGTIWHNGMTDPLNDWTRDPTQAFRDLWTAIHGDDAWAANPEVIALTFTVHKGNIDRPVSEKP